MQVCQTVVYLYRKERKHSKELHRYRQMNKRTQELLNNIIEAQENCSEIKFSISKEIVDRPHFTIYDCSHSSIEKLIELGCLVSMNEKGLTVTKLSFECDKEVY